MVRPIVHPETNEHRYGIYMYIMKQVSDIMYGEINDNIARETIVDSCNPLLKYYSMNESDGLYICRDVTTPKEIDKNKVVLELLNGDGEVILKYSVMPDSIVTHEVD